MASETKLIPPIIKKSEITEDSKMLPEVLQPIKKLASTAVIDTVKRSSCRRLSAKNDKKESIKEEKETQEVTQSYERRSARVASLQKQLINDEKPSKRALQSSEIKKRIKIEKTVVSQDTNHNVCDIEKVKLIPEGFLEIDSGELDLERTLLGGQSFRWVKEDICSIGPVFTGIILDNALQLWRISEQQIAFRTLNKEAQLSKTKALLEDYFQLKYNLKDLYAEWSVNDAHLAECCKKYTGFRILRQNPEENVFSFICATNNNIKRISQMVDKLCKRFGTILESKDRQKSVYDSYQSFPSVERLCGDDVNDCLRNELGFGYRAKYIIETARKINDLSLASSYKSPRDYLLSLRNLSYKETCAKLMQFSGIGRKVADCICLMSMDHLNAVPTDCHIYDIVSRHYLPELKSRKSLTNNVHDLIGEHFYKLHGPLAGWSTSVLFIADLKHLKLKDESQKTAKKVK